MDSLSPESARRRRPLSVVGLALCVALAGCGTPGDRRPADRPRDLDSVPDARPRAEPLSRYGNPPWYEANGQRYQTLPSAVGYRARGIASWYGPDFHGKLTSTREPYDMYAMTAAHPTLPLPSYAQVTNLENGRRVVVRVNDRGPFHDNRVIDLSYTAAHKLGILGPGTGLVEVRAIDPRSPEDLRIAEGPQPPPERRPDVYLQVGAFANRDNALRLQSRVVAAAEGAPSLKASTLQERALYKVRLGPLSGVEEADRLVAVLAQLGIADHQIVVE
jgi:rare lipoprotein A